MQTTVYADLYFLINTSMNLLCLYLTGGLLHYPVRRWRILLAASLGGIYAVLFLLWGGVFPELLTDCAMAFVMCAISFAASSVSIPRLLRCTGLHMLVSMLLGGIMTGLYSLLNRMELPLSELGEDDISVWLFAGLSAISAIVTAFGGRLFSRLGTKKSVTVHAVLFGRELIFSALVDTGNLLCDPISGKGVILVERKKLLAALPAPLCEALTQKAPDASLSNRRYLRALRLIPAMGATGERLLPAILPDSVLITAGKETYPADYLLAPADLGDRALGFEGVMPGS